MIISQRDLILIQFPFTDTSETKPRPVIVMSNEDYNRKFKDFIGIPLTTNLKSRDFTLLITNRDMESGILYEDSIAKVDRISALSQYNIMKKIGRVKITTHNNLKTMLLQII